MRPTFQHQGASPLSVTNRRLLRCGIVGQTLFIGTYLIEGVTRPGYDATRQPVSALSLGSSGWVQDASFVVFGLLLGCFAVGLRAALVSGIGAAWAPLLQGVIALGTIIDGVFAQDPLRGYPHSTLDPAASTVHGLVHTLGASIVFIALPACCFVLARRFGTEARGRGWAAYSVATGILVCSCLAAFIATHDGTGPAGVFERAATLIAAVWMLALTARLLAAPGRLPPRTMRGRPLPGLPPWERGLGTMVQRGTRRLSTAKEEHWS